MFLFKNKNRTVFSVLVFLQLLGCALGLGLLIVNPGISPDSMFLRLGFVYFVGMSGLTGVYFFKGPRSEKFLEMEKTFQNRLEFLAALSHELRTPLTSILGYSDLGRKDLQDGKLERVGEAFSVIQKNSIRLLGLVGDLLTLSKNENQRETLHREWHRIEEIQSEVFEILQERRLQNGFEFQSHIQGEFVFCDRSKILQVLVNLLENAMRYSPQLSTLKVFWHEIPHKKGAVQLEVIDSGPGISPEHHHLIFEKFYRVEQSRNRDQGGTGLGLAIVKQIVKEHGGEVGVDSQLGKGARFWCVFPSPS